MIRPPAHPHHRVRRRPPGGGAGRCLWRGQLRQSISAREKIDAELAVGERLFARLLEQHRKRIKADMTLDDFVSELQQLTSLQVTFLERREGDAHWRALASTLGTSAAELAAGLPALPSATLVISRGCRCRS